MKILKFGGSSVATTERIQNVVNILKNYHSKGERFAVVFSAFGGITNLLIKMSELAAVGDREYLNLLQTFKRRHLEVIYMLLKDEDLDIALKIVDDGFKEIENLLRGIFLIKETTPRASDYLQSFGERNSSYIISRVLQQEGLNVNYLDARKVVQTDNTYGRATVLFNKTTSNIKSYFKKSKADYQIITGYIGSTADGSTTTLGRGGSDYTAAIFASCLDAEVIEIWTDVDGVMTADPRKVKKAFTIPTLTYAEAMEMSHFGAKVIYPPTIQPALLKNIPLRIKNTFNPTFEGTLIGNDVPKSDLPISGVTSITNVALMTLQGTGMFGVSGIAARLFSILAQKAINIILITQGSSEHSITFAVAPNDAQRAKVAIEETFVYEIEHGKIEPLIIEDNLSAVAIIGENMKKQSGVSGRLFQSLGKNGINVSAIAQGSSELNISVVVSKDDVVKALNAIHEGFFLSDTKTVHVFVVGVGLIGKTLLKQIYQQTSHLKSSNSLEIKVVALANTKKMVFDVDGVDLDNWETVLNNSQEVSNLNGFIDKMISLNLNNSIFVDNTATSSIVKYYEQILEESISISTPNKIATSSSYLQYQNLKALATKNNVKFLYETNVGAGLPVISTLNNLISSGDRILKIEGVLSGSLSFIFNNFNPSISFYDIVKQAQQLGYTEPDPRDDLSGLDVRRKILILARETGLALEAENVVIENILPQESLDAPSVDDFFKTLNVFNDFFSKKVEQASAKGNALRFIAALEGEKATIALKEVDATNPFYGLSGSDNMIVFTTERYKERPLVVRGPGAGAEVTAAGVFAEIITIANYLS